MAALAAYPIFTAIASSVVGGLVSRTLFSPDKPQPITAPVIEKPTLMPTPDDAVVQAAKRKAAASLATSSGRLSTILTPPDDKLGG